MTTVVADGVAKRYGTHVALEPTSFTLRPGTVTALVGANGSGKSTLLKRLLGLVAGAGETTFDGRRYRDLERPARTVGIALDVQQLDAAHTPAAHLARVAAATGADAAAITRMLATLDLAHVRRRRVARLSLGMRQRLSLAAALLPDPQVLVLDEPGNGMDPAGLHWLQALVRQRARDGGTVLLSSHLLADVEACADRVLVLDHGRLLFDGELADLLHPAGGRCAARCDEPARLVGAALAAGAVRATVTETGLVRVDGLSVHDLATVAVGSGVRLHEVRPDGADLTSAYFGLVAGSSREADRVPA